MIKLSERLNRRLKELRIINIDIKTPIARGWSYYCMEDKKLNHVIETSYVEENRLHYDKRKVVAKVLLMYIKDYDISQITEETKLSKSSIYNYISKYKSNKNFIYNIGKKPKQTICALEPYKFKIVTDFEKAHIKTYKEAQERIFKITGIHRTIPRIYEFLTKHNFKKINGYYIQEPTAETIKIRLQWEKQFLHESVDEVKEFIDDNHLFRKRGLPTIIRNQFGIKYVSEYKLREYIRKNRLSGYLSGL